MSKNLEDKLDRYYDDLMGKILELLKLQEASFETVREIKKELNRLGEKVNRLQNEMGSGGGTGARSFGGGGGSDMGRPMEGGAPKPMGSAPPPPGQPRSLKDFLAQEFSIFDVKVLNAFIKATKEVIKSNVRTEPTFLKPRIEGNMKLAIVISGNMKLTRDNQNNGTMGLAFEAGSGLAITRAMFFMPEDAPVKPADTADVTKEICNQICGKSKILLKNDGYSFDIGMPEIHQGTAEELQKKLGAPKIALNFEFGKDPFYILFWEN